MALGWNPSPVAPSTAEFLNSKEFTQQRVIHRLLLGERVDVLDRQGLSHWESGWFTAYFLRSDGLGLILPIYLLLMIQTLRPQCH